MHASRHLQQLVRAKVHAREHVATLVHHVREPRVVDDHRIQSLHGDRTLSGCRHRQEERLGHAAFVEILPNHADRLATVIMLRVDLRIRFLHMTGSILGPGARRQEHRHAAPIRDHLLQEPVIQEVSRIAREHLDRRLLRLVEAVHLQHVAAVEILGIERRIHRGRQPDEAAACTLAEREAEFKLGGRLMDLVNHHRVVVIDVAVLEPAPRDAGGDDDHVPLRGVGCRLALAIDDPDDQLLTENRLGDRSDRKRLACARAGNDAEPASARGEFTHACTVVNLEVRLEIQRERELDGLARRTGRCNDDDAPTLRARRPERFRVWREVSVTDVTHDGNLPATTGNQPTVTETRLVVSLPKMSMTFTATANRCGLG